MGRFQLITFALLTSSCATTGKPSQAALTLPFALRGHSGEVSIAYEANHDPKRWGFDLINLPFDAQRTRGFPVFDARVHYDGEGYRALLGWIQLVTVEPTNGEKAYTSIDQIPIHRQSDTPFMTFGSAPEAFDAPGPNPPRTDETWTSYTFLAICPDLARTRRVAAVLGIRWGYVLKDGKPTMQPIEVTDAAAWDKVLPVLKESYPDWEFISGFVVQ